MNYNYEYVEFLINEHLVVSEENAENERGQIMGIFDWAVSQDAVVGVDVADIVDMVRHNNINVHIEWKPEKMQLVEYKSSKNRFFVRTTSSKAEIEAVFGTVAYVEGIVEGEFGFCTEVMTEAEFEEKSANINVVSRIRLG